MSADFNERFSSHMERYPPETRELLETLADHDSLLCLEGIVKVLDVLHKQEPQSELTERLNLAFQ